MKYDPPLSHEILSKLKLVYHKGFFGTAEYSEPDHIYYGSIQGIRDLVSYAATSYFELERCFELAVKNYVRQLTRTPAQYTPLTV